MTTTPIVEKPLNIRVPRRAARQRVEALMYLDLGAENGGFPINISEDGMSFQGIRPLQVDQEIFITFKLDGTNESVTTKAKIVWLTETRKAGALQFVDLSEEGRGRITEWIALQKEDENLQQDAVPHPAAAESPKAEGEEAPINLVPAAMPVTPSSNPMLAQADMVAALPPVGAASAIPVEQPAPPKAIFQTLPEMKRSLPVQPSSGPSKLQQTGRFPVPLDKKKKNSGRSRSLEIGLAAFGAIAIVCGVLIWPSHVDLLQRFHWNPAMNAERPAAPAPKAVAPTEEAPIADIPSDLPMKDPSQVSAFMNAQEDLAAPSSPDMPATSRVDRAQQQVPATRPANREADEAAPFFSLKAMRPRKTAIASARNRQSAAAPPDSILENTSQLPGAGAGSGKILLLDHKAPVSPVTTTGSVEIIPDPYPSIRMPADSQGPSSRLGTSLQIGRLSNKVSPVYPPEALRQRIAGKVKLHILIGRTGAVASASIVEGPTSLAEAALRAVQQWRYEPTMVGGTAVEVEQDVTVVFRVTNSSSPAN